MDKVIWCEFTRAEPNITFYGGWCRVTNGAWFLKAFSAVVADTRAAEAVIVWGVFRTLGIDHATEIPNANQFQMC